MTEQELAKTLEFTHTKFILESQGYTVISKEEMEQFNILVFKWKLIAMCVGAFAFAAYFF